MRTVVLVRKRKRTARIINRRHISNKHCGIVMQLQQFISITLIGVVADPSAKVSSPTHVAATSDRHSVVGGNSR